MPNYNAFVEDAAGFLNAQPEPGRFFLIYADIAEFQLVNRFYGFPEGDRLLLAAEEFLTKTPGVALFRRVFSDQFLILADLEGRTSNAEIVQAINAWTEAFIARQRDNYPSCNLKISCGVSPIVENSLETAVDSANMARKEAKKRGSSGAVLFDSTALEQIAKRRETEQEINLALQEKRFVFFLQPKVDLISGKIIGAEALARRIRPGGKVIFPDSFLPIMEANGTIVSLDILIFEQVCAYLSQRIRSRLPVVRTSVNLSRLHIQNPDTAKKLHAIAQAYQIPPDFLEFELTETILLDEFTGAKALIDQLRAYRYHVSIDDFGAGYAGINIWQELNFDTLKLDRIFLSEDEDLKARNAAIVPNVINIAQRLHISVICEGVEQEEQCAYLLRLGCTAVQGFYFSRPVPPEQFYATYEAQHGRYPLPFRQKDGGPAPPEETAPRRAARAPRPPMYFLLLIFCAVFLIGSVALTFSYYRQTVSEMFIDSINYNLDSYMSGQMAATDGRIDGLANTLRAFAALIGQRQSPDFIDTYVQALNEHERDVTFLFTTAEEFDERAASGLARPEDIESIERMKTGETVISQIAFSTFDGDSYSFTIGVPVFIDGAFAGGLRAVVHADVLTSTEQYASPYGTVHSSYLADAQGKLIQTDAAGDTGGSLFRLLEPYRFSDEAIRSVEDALASAVTPRSLRLGESGGAPYYISVAPLAYNGWNLVVLFRADAAVSTINTLVRYTVLYAAVISTAILTVCLLLFIYLRRSGRDRAHEMQRYLLLEQFSDTILFDYDCNRDVIRFTPNASQLFHVHDLVQPDFLARLDTLQNIYSGDHPIVKEILSGQGQDGKPEVRIRLRHPTQNRYYWCLIQYKYLYREGRLTSIIGKIVNIDEQQRHEEFLLEQSSRDGLTGLYNRPTTENRITQCMLEDETGLLFMFDIDDFKRINDTLGHDTGDRALRFIAESLQKIFRADDVIGRVGGDELLVYVRGSGDPAVGRSKMDTLWQLLEDHPDAPLSISVGIARHPADGENYEALFHAADQAMYRAKRLGKRQYCFYDEAL